MFAFFIEMLLPRIFDKSTSLLQEEESVHETGPHLPRRRQLTRRGMPQFARVYQSGPIQRAGILNIKEAIQGYIAALEEDYLPYRRIATCYGFSQ